MKHNNKDLKNINCIRSRSIIRWHKIKVMVTLSKFFSWVFSPKWKWKDWFEPVLFSRSFSFCFSDVIACFLSKNLHVQYNRHLNGIHKNHNIAWDNKTYSLIAKIQFNYCTLVVTFFIKQNLSIPNCTVCTVLILWH